MRDVIATRGCQNCECKQQSAKLSSRLNEGREDHWHLIFPCDLPANDVREPDLFARLRRFVQEGTARRAWGES
jgi:hypothetical protein